MSKVIRTITFTKGVALIFNPISDVVIEKEVELLGRLSAEKFRKKLIKDTAFNVIKVKSLVYEDKTYSMSVEKFILNSELITAGSTENSQCDTGGE